MRFLGWPCAFLLFLSLSLSSQGAPVSKIATTDKSGIEISVTPSFENSPVGGCVPIQLKIINRSRSNGEWTMQVDSPGGNMAYGGAQTISSSFTLRVEAGAERTATFLVPSPMPSASTYLNNAMQLNVVGPGVLPGETIINSNRNTGGQRRIGNIGFSENLDAISGTELKKQLQAKGMQPEHPVIDLSSVPADWRAFSAFDQIWLTSSEWEALPADGRQAFEQWIATGGTLFLCQSGDIEPVRKMGFGCLRMFPLNLDGSLDIPKTISAIEALDHDGREDLYGEYKSKWPDKTWIPPYQPNAPLLIGIIILFGVVVGPINFFVMAGKERRVRIFWLTPLISLIGLALISLTIFVQDGFGGWGHRMGLICLLPDKNSEVLIQEQVSKTGVLLGGDFHLEANALLLPIMLNNRKQSFSVEGSDYSGNWFQSRSVQGQILTAVRPSRARVELQNPTEVAQGAAPRVISSIGATLEDIFFMSNNHEVFHGRNLGPGRVLTLEKSEVSACRVAMSHACFDTTGPFLQMRAGFKEMIPGWFYSTATAPKGALLDTLPSLNWRQDRVFYLGPIAIP